MRPGDRVMILPGDEYDGKMAGRTGTVRYVIESDHCRVGVIIDKDTEDGKGKDRKDWDRACWFKMDALQPIDGEGVVTTKFDRLAKLQLLADPNDAKPHYYYAFCDPTIHSGDIVTMKHGRRGASLAKVLEVLPPDTTAIIRSGHLVVEKVELPERELAHIARCGALRTMEGATIMLGPREIVSRGKKVNGGGWVKGYYTLGVCQSGPDEERIYPCIKTFSGRSYEVDPDTVGQDTGVRDRNDIEVFEDDVVRIWGRRLYTVRFESGQFCVGAHCPIGYYRSICEVVGNIHDSPPCIDRQRGRPTSAKCTKRGKRPFW